MLDIRIAEGKSIDVVSNAPIIQSMQDVATPEYMVMREVQYSLRK